MTNNYDFSILQKSQLTGKPVLHFAHANGMPSLCYKPLLDVLAKYFSIEYIPLLGNTEGYRVDEHWQSLTEQVVDSVSHVCHKHNINSVVGLGHSLGSLCTLQALYRQPHLFSQVILCDPALIYGWHSLLLHIGKQIDKLPHANHCALDKISPSGLSRHRKDIWDNREQAKTSFSNKKFFANFDYRCFEAYINHGLQDTDDGKVTLAIPKDAEVSIFRTNPSWFWLTPNTPPEKPVHNIVGEDSIFLHNKFPQKIQKRLKIPFSTHVGGHMFPLEHPESVAIKVLETCQQQIL